MCSIASQGLSRDTFVQQGWISTSSQATAARRAPHPLDTYNDILQTVTAVSSAMATGSPELRALSSVCSPHSIIV
jgi:hypothetical protein